MRLYLWLFFFWCCWSLPAQVFMRPVDNAAALTLGGADLAYPGTDAGLANDAVPGFGDKRGLFLGSALPFGISGWRSAQVQGFIAVSARDGFGLEIAHSAIDVYGEQRFRLQYGRRLGEKFLMGGSADLLRVSAREYGSAAAVTFGLSMLANPLPGVWLAARVQNPLQQKIAGDVLPTVLRIGAGWKASDKLILLAEVEKDLERQTQVKAGAEYRPAPLLSVRAGVRSEPARFAFGAGIHLKHGLSLHSGAEWHPVLGLTPVGMVVWRKK